MDTFNDFCNKNYNWIKEKTTIWVLKKFVQKFSQNCCLGYESNRFLYAIVKKRYNLSDLPSYVTYGLEWNGVAELSTIDEFVLKQLDFFVIVVEIEMVPALSSFVNCSSGRIESAKNKFLYLNFNTHWLTFFKFGKFLPN